MQADDRNQIEKAAIEILHPASRQLFRYWEGLRAERPCPTRSEIELSRLVSLLPNIAILEKPVNERWTYRLAGTKVCDLLQQPMTGKDALAGFKRYFKGEVVMETYTALNQLDYGAELSKMRASGADSVYIFLPGGLGINFIKQFVGAGLSKDMTLFGPGFSGDEDVIKAVGEPMLGMFNTSQWAHDMNHPANVKFVTDFQKEYNRLPTLYAAQAYDAAKLMDAAVRDVKGKLDDKAAVHKALMAAKFESVRGPFKFNTNQFPIQDYYLRVITRDTKGRITNRMLGKVFEQHGDAYVGECHMPAL